MNITGKEQEAFNYAKELNPVVRCDSSGINWHWCTGFTNYSQGETFDKWCVSKGLETRGVYSERNGTSAVRFRQN